LREEDPFTGIWAGVSKNHIVGHASRFEFDLNRSPDRAIYLTPADAWGLNVWKRQPSEEILEKSRSCYNEIYQRIHQGLSRLVDRFGNVVVLDIHSYNHRRDGPDAPSDDPAMNPEINIGTGTMDRAYWASIVDRCIADLRESNVLGRPLDVRENIKFRGGYFPKWIHENFSDSVCCISIEVKKFFMDEWTGNPDWQTINSIKEAFKALIKSLLEEISLRGYNPEFDSKV
jgi:N-formylglutamate amidohydrolase